MKAILPANSQGFQSIRGPSFKKNTNLDLVIQAIPNAVFATYSHVNVQLLQGVLLVKEPSKIQTKA